MIPQNLLGTALSIIGKQTFQYVRFLGRQTNSIGNDVATYAVPIPMMGNVQEVPRELFQHYGLLFDKDYKIFYVSEEINVVQRGSSGDHFIFGNETYQVLSDTDWYFINGWAGIIGVRIPGGCPC
jgi:hypothetical protein